MRKRVFSKITLWIGLAIPLLAILSGCSSYNCRQPLRTYPVPGAPNQAKEVTPQLTVPQSAGAESERKVLIYKYDGSLQCNQGKAVTAESMEKELQGIKIFSREKKHDGLMHIQVCGSRTGYANVYEILERDRKKAEERKFQLWPY